MTSTEYHKMLFQAMPLACILIKPNPPLFTIIDANKAYLEITKASVEGLLEKPFFEAFPNYLDTEVANESANLAQSFQKVILTCSTDKLTVQKYHINIGNTFATTPRHFSVDNTPLLNPDGSVALIMHVVTDMTEKVQLQNKQQPQLEQKVALNPTVDSDVETHTEIGTWEMNLETGIFSWSPELFAICGYQPDAFTPSLEKALEIIHTDDHESVILAYKNAIENGIPYRIKHRLLRPSGEIIVAISIGFITKDINGKPISLAGLFQNITKSEAIAVKLQQTISSLQQQNEFTQTIIQSLPIGVAINKISDGKATGLNKHFSNIYGWSEEVLIDVPTFFEKVYPDEAYRKSIIDRIMADIKSGDINRMAWNNIEITTQTGEKRFINAKNIPLFEQDLMISTVMDVTEITTQSKEIGRIKSNQEALINATEDAIWSIDTNACLVTANKAYSKNIQAVGSVVPKEGDSVFIKEFGEALNIKWQTYYARALNGEHYAIKEQFYNPTTDSYEYGIISFNPIYNEVNTIIGVACYSKNITDEVLTNKTLEATKNKLSRVLDSSLDVICVIDEANIFLQVSAASETVWGYKPEELVGKSIMDFIYSEDLVLTKAKVVEIMAGNKSTNFENRYVRKDGSLVWMEWTANWDDQNRVRYGVGRNITDKKQQQTALIESEKKYKTLFENNPLPMIIWDFETLVIVDCNQEAEIKYGYTKAEFLQLTIKDIRPQEDVTLIETATKSEADYGQIHKQIWRHKKKNGDIMFMDISGHLFDYNGRRVTLVLLNDVTEKLAVEEEIKKSEAKYRTLVENSLDAILLTLQSGEILSANAAACKIFKMTEAEICSVGRAGLVDESDPRILKLLQERTRAGKAKGELRFKRKDGTTFLGEITSVIVDTSDNIQKTSTTIKDITDVKLAEAALKQSEEKYKILFERSPLPKWIYDIATFNILEANDAAIKHYGYSKDEFLTLNLKDLRPASEISHLQKAQNSITNRDGILHFGKFIHQKKDGTIIQVEISGNKFTHQNKACMMVVCLDVTEREKAFQILKDRELKLTTAQQVAKLGYWDYHFKTETLTWSDELYKVFDIDKTQFLLTPDAFINLVSEKDRQLILQTSKHAQATGKAYTITYHITTHSGQKRIIQENGYGETDDNGNITRLFGTAQNVTEYKLAEEKIIQSNQRYEYVTKATSDAIWDWDLLTDKIYWGEGFETIFGHNLKTIQANISFRLHHIHPDDVEAVMAGLYYVIYGKETQWEDNYRFRKADGTYAYVTNKGFVIRDNTGKATRMVGAKRDVTKQREEELRLQLLESVITNTSDMVIITEAEPIDGLGPRIVYINDAFTDITGFTQADIVGKTPRLLQGPKTDKQELDKLKASLQAWQPYNATIINYKKNGEEFWNNMNISPVADVNGIYTHWIAVERDVTERMQHERDIVQAIIKTQEEERYEVGSELHDNVCQILTSSKIAFKMVENTLPPNKISIFNDGIEALNMVFKEIRNLSHRLAPVFLDDTTLEEAFRNTLKTFNADDNYKIVLNFDEAFKDYPATKEFQLNLYRILQEQLNNILKYAKATTITVQGYIHQQLLVLSISDDGIGFDRSAISTGIGLSNMRRRAELFNGKFSIDTAPSKGCKLTVEIPLKDVK